MLNRLQFLFGPPREPDPTVVYYLVETRLDSFAVSRAVAMGLVRALESAEPPAWLVFRDVVGTAHRLRSAEVYRITESTPELRAALRAFRRAMRREGEDDEFRWDE